MRLPAKNRHISQPMTNTQKMISSIGRDESISSRKRTPENKQTKVKNNHNHANSAVRQKNALAPGSTSRCRILGILVLMVSFLPSLTRPNPLSSKNTDCVKYSTSATGSKRQPGQNRHSASDSCNPSPTDIRHIICALPLRFLARRRKNGRGLGRGFRFAPPPSMFLPPLRGSTPVDYVSISHRPRR